MELAKKSASRFYIILSSQSKPVSNNVLKNMTYKKKILVKIVDESKLTLLAAWCNWERLTQESDDPGYNTLLKTN